MQEQIQKIANEYNAKIHPLRSKNGVAYINTQAKAKITARLKDFTLEELLKALDIFSKNNWQMENNSHRGLAWFFNTEDRIERFLNMKEDKVVSSNGKNKWKIGELEYDLEEIKAAEARGEIVYEDGKYIPRRTQKA